MVVLQRRSEVRLDVEIAEPGVDERDALRPVLVVGRLFHQPKADRERVVEVCARGLSVVRLAVKIADELEALRQLPTPEARRRVEHGRRRCSQLERRQLGPDGEALERRLEGLLARLLLLIGLAAFEQHLGANAGQLRVIEPDALYLLNRLVDDAEHVLDGRDPNAFDVPKSIGDHGDQVATAPLAAS